MIRSMTGFGAAETEAAGRTVRAELRSVNHKGLRISVRAPDRFAARQQELEQIIKESVDRGHVYLTVECEANPEQAELSVDTKRLRSYMQLIKTLADEEGLDVEVDAASLLLIPGVLGEENLEEASEKHVWEAIQDVCREALGELVERREQEGANLQEQLEEICRNIGNSVETVESACGSLVEEYQQRLRERVESLLEGTDAELDEDSLSREVAVFAEKSDVSEEIARLRSHLKQFQSTLDESPPRAGKKLGFLAQEMLREANTMAAKMPGADQTHETVGIKTAIDQLREQIRNIE